MTMLLWAWSSQSPQGMRLILTHPASSSTGEAVIATHYELRIAKGWINFWEVQFFQTDPPSPSGISELASIHFALAIALTSAPPILWLVLRLKSKPVPSKIPDISN